MILLIDNYDSFTWNLVQCLGELGGTPSVVRNDEITIGEVERLAPRAIIISPGPGRPSDAGVSRAVVARYSGHIPILGVCLGHQCIAEAFGARVVRADRLVHGKTSPVLHTACGLFEGIESPFHAMRYHSLIVSQADLPRELRVLARTHEGEIMALCHTKHETWGVQFHPESILTRRGMAILENFLRRLPGGVPGEAGDPADVAAREPQVEGDADIGCRGPWR